MGNNASTPQTRTPRASHPSSPLPRTSPLPDDAAALPRHKSGRRKKSIELADDSSLQFTHSSGSQGGASRRKLGLGVNADEEEAVDDGNWTLRGAMQGRAEHVVYGPRREESSDGHPDIIPSRHIPPTSTSIGRPVTIALPPHPMFTPAPLTDSDDVIHPGFKGSPRLTSDVLMSSDKMPVMTSPMTEEGGSKEYPFGPAPDAAKPSFPALNDVSRPPTPVSLTGVAQAILAPVTPAPTFATVAAHNLLPPTTSTPYPPTHAPLESVVAPLIPVDHLPIAESDIPSGTGVVASPVPSPPQAGTPNQAPSPQSTAVLIPPAVFNAPAAVIPIPLLSMSSEAVAENLRTAAVDVGAGQDGVATLIKWKDEEGQGKTPDGKAFGPKEVYVTGTFAKGWKMKIELRKNSAGDFSALILIPPGPHRLKFIVDKEWRTSQHLQLATDADGNLINYLEITAPTSTTVPSSGAATPSQWTMPNDDDDLVPYSDPEEGEWTSELPAELQEWSEYEQERDAAESGFQAVPGGPQSPVMPTPPSWSNVAPPALPAQLEKGPLNHAAYVASGSGDDNSILPKPDHTVINHLAASPIKGGYLSVGVTTRYKRKFVTIVYYKALTN
ncbi:AMP-activated protein kinase beta subunit [Pseudohyphozyma bogoriensis]|nr:AMP-activated protein kinase beta subunit [Pseudohyphozyma bogoriensis]